jgi:hypothetical protein
VGGSRMVYGRLFVRWVGEVSWSRRHRGMAMWA